MSDKGIHVPNACRFLVGQPPSWYPRLATSVTFLEGDKFHHALLRHAVSSVHTATLCEATRGVRRDQHVTGAEWPKNSVYLMSNLLRALGLMHETVVFHSRHVGWLARRAGSDRLAALKRRMVLVRRYVPLYLYLYCITFTRNGTTDGAGVGAALTLQIRWPSQCPCP